MVIIGEGRLAAEKGLSARDLPREGFRVKTFAGGVGIVGRLPDQELLETVDGRQQYRIGCYGTIFGVEDFLERFLGIRWYYPGEDGRIVPKAKDLTIPPCEYIDAPVRHKRHGIAGDVNVPGNGEDLFLSALRYRAGLGTTVSTGCHTPHNFGAVHGQEHPEVMELRPDGSRDPYMPCWGNPLTLKLMIQDLENFYDRGDGRPWLHPNGQSLWQPPTKWTIHISPVDKAVDCKCAYCREKMDYAADAYGRASRLLAEFVSAYAREIKARWPEKTVFFLPYSNYTTPPAGFKFASDNVVAGVCLMRGAANDKEPDVAREHDAMIAGWAAATGKPVHLWEYQCWPAIDTALPFQYPHVIQSFQQRHRHDIAGSFLNGGGASPALPGGDWQIQHPTLYCWFRLLWNPDFNVDAALAEYTRLMYGPAEKPLAAILALLTDRWEKTRWSQPPAGFHVSPKMIHEETMPRPEALKLRGLLAEARGLAPAGTVERRRVDFFGKAIELFLEESDNYHTGAGLPTLMALKVGADPIVDGRLDEPCWRDSERQNFKRGRREDPDPIPGKTETTVQAVWTANGVTFAFKLMSPDPERLRSKINIRDQAGMWWEDSVEIFLDPEGNRTKYYQFVVNALGNIFDTSSFDGAYNASGVKAAAAKGKDHWSLEVFIPYAAFHGKIQPAVGAVWYANFIRNQPTGEAEHPDQPGFSIAFQRWSTLDKPSHHDFAAFGKLRFVE